ncbi:hypothetical protein GE09DRAFT_392670 [Coniochaeta sp. 2T2.1]|nr:hypothetical protein GE09DRAFT_392670 [Coniochaeta sp. 2T2.1]
MQYASRCPPRMSSSRAAGLFDLIRCKPQPQLRIPKPPFPLDLPIMLSRARSLLIQHCSPTSQRNWYQKQKHENRKQKAESNRGQPHEEMGILVLQRPFKKRKHNNLIVHTQQSWMSIGGRSRRFSRMSVLHGRFNALRLVLFGPRFPCSLFYGVGVFPQHNPIGPRFSCRMSFNQNKFLQSVKSFVFPLDALVVARIG